MINMNLYAQALFEVLEDPLLVYDELKILKEVLKDTTVMNTMKRSYVDESTLDPLWQTLNFQAETIRCLKILHNDQRMIDFDRFFDAYVLQCTKAGLLSCAQVKSAKALSHEEILELQSVLKKSYPGRIEIQYEVDPSLIKGLAIRINNDVIDTSIKHKLKQIYNQGGQ